jgi:UDP-N-acetyl-2-amino-2-deoxyglucuronate dehydrogenase
MNKVRFGIIGMGVMGTNHATWFRDGKVPNGKVTAVCDILEERRNWSKENLSSEVRIFSEYHDLLKSGEIDAVLIATPHYLHPTIAKEALELGLHVLSEKPAGVYTKAVREMNAYAATKPDLVFGIMLNERTNPVFKKAKELIESGVIGNLRKAIWITTDWWRPQSYYNSSNWRATWSGEGGGVLINQAPHQIDLLQWICGMPVKVNADLKYGSHRDIVVEDDASIYLTFANGATGTFIICTHDILGTNYFEILGDKGKITIEKSKSLTAKILHESENDMNERITFEDAKKIINGERLDDICSTITCNEYNTFGEQHHIILNDFCNAVLEGKTLYVHGSEGIKSLTISNAMHLSSWLEHEIDIPFDEEIFYKELQKRIAEEAAYKKR